MYILLKKYIAVQNLRPEGRKKTQEHPADPRGLSLRGYSITGKSKSKEDFGNFPGSGLFSRKNHCCVFGKRPKRSHRKQIQKRKEIVAGIPENFSQKPGNGEAKTCVNSEREGVRKKFTSDFYTVK